MFNFSFNFKSDSELQITDNTDYTEETIDSIEIVLNSYSKDTNLEQTFLYFSPDSTLLPLTSSLNEVAIYSLVQENESICKFPDGIYTIKVNITSGTQTVCESYFIFKDLDLQKCRKKELLEYIKDSNCEVSCDILLFSTILETIHIEVCDKNFTQAELLHKYLKDICNKCSC